MNLETSDKMAARPMTQFESILDKAKSEVFAMREQEIVDPSKIESLASMLLGQAESLQQELATLEARLSPIINHNQDWTVESSRPESDSPLGSKLADVYMEVDQVITRIRLIRGAIRL